MIYRWWSNLNNKLEENEAILSSRTKNKKLHHSSKGLLSMGKGTYISEDSKLNGNIEIGNNCMIGTGVILRGSVRIYDNVKIGYGVEVKDSVIKENTSVGPLCYLGNSLIEKDVYLGALVRTSNHRLDRSKVKSWNGEYYGDTGLEKLGAWIKEESSIGVGVVILPGRIIPENSVFGPHIVVTKNYPPGIYKMKQNIEKTDGVFR